YFGGCHSPVNGHAYVLRFCDRGGRGHDGHVPRHDHDQAPRRRGMFAGAKMPVFVGVLMCVFVRVGHIFMHMLMLMDMLIDMRVLMGMLMAVFP
ncbi:MAG: hypothetical protein JW781_02360, partial [Deltaproteobacteria bacterium]|nr:hypothetical protein [Candidatus Anaeroferrophillacea bacterium]